MSANDKQVGGDHYSKEGEQHWDRIYRLHGRGYFVGCATKYIERYHLKNGKQDLEKAIHFIEKLIELEYPKETPSAKLKDIEESLRDIGKSVGIKYPGDYQEKLSADMAKMREDAMIGIPDHLREEIQRAYTTDLRERLDTMKFDPGPQLKLKERSKIAKSLMEEMPESLQGVSPMLKNFWGADEEPLPHGYVNQDGPDVR